MKREIHFLNHTSLMFEYDNWFLLLDPWPTDSLAFDGWKSFPPSFLNDNILAAFINASSNNSAVIISHGHDDHCDDVFLKTLSGNTNIIFPDYPKKGALRRLNGNGLKNIQETRDLEKINSFELKSFNLRSYYHKNILAFGDLLHKVHPLAGQGFNMTIRDIKVLSQIIKKRLDLGLLIDSSISLEFQKKIKHKNLIFSNGIDLIHEFFNIERKTKTNFLSKSVKLVGDLPSINRMFAKIADKGILF